MYVFLANLHEASSLIQSINLKGVLHPPRLRRGQPQPREILSADVFKRRHTFLPATQMTFRLVCHHAKSLHLEMRYESNTLTKNCASPCLKIKQTSFQVMKILKIKVGLVCSRSNTKISWRRILAFTASCPPALRGGGYGLLTAAPQSVSDHRHSSPKIEIGFEK